MVMISESDIIRFLRRWGDSFVDVTDFFSQLGIKFFAEIICNTKNFCHFALCNHDITTSLFTAKLLNISDITKESATIFRLSTLFYAFF